jgi:hypothetical protein
MLAEDVNENVAILNEVVADYWQEKPKEKELNFE